MCEHDNLTTTRTPRACRVTVDHCMLGRKPCSVVYTWYTVYTCIDCGSTWETEPDDNCGAHGPGPHSYGWQGTSNSYQASELDADGERTSFLYLLTLDSTRVVIYSFTELTNTSQLFTITKARPTSNYSSFSLF